MTTHPQAWRGHAEANHRHEVARRTGTGRGVAFEVSAPRVSFRWVHIAVSGAVMWAVIFVVCIGASALFGGAG